MKKMPLSLYQVALLTSTLGILVFLLDSGFDQVAWLQHLFNIFYFIVVILGLAATTQRYLKHKMAVSKKVLIFDVLTSLLIIGLVIWHFIKLAGSEQQLIFYEDTPIKMAVFFTFLRELSASKFNLNRAFLNPAQLFIISYLLVIFSGAFLLMMPKATTTPISFVDALFTATSAVCVTGLIVVDTATRFTALGQSIIMGLIEVGGLGILTFATYFSYFFKGGISYETQLSMGEMTNAQRIGDVLATLKYILFVTFGVEACSAALIYLSVLDLPDMTVADRLFFSVFHSISAFCNAGFSTFSDSLYAEQVRDNYPLQLIVALTFLFGGMGFVIVVNTLNYLRYGILRLLFRHQDRYHHQPWLLNINSRINLITSGLLLLLGFVGVMLFEYHGTLAEHGTFVGKAVTGLFTAATPRTAGFNAVDMADLAFPTIILTIFLMWVGASPNSTGGGIKTSTFAVAALNTLSVARGQSRVEVFRREIATISIRRAFAIMWLSFLVIGTAITLISYNQPEIPLLDVVFECFSAYSTVGLSLGITSQLSTFSKSVIIVVMFVGRVSMLSIIIAVIKKVRHRNYRYPTEEISIN